MKNKLQKIAVFLLLILCNYSCKKSDQNRDQPGNSTSISSDVLSSLKKQGFKTDDVKKVNGGYLVEGDIFMSAASITDTVGKDRHKLLIASNEQYNTNNLLYGTFPRVINILVNGFSQNYVDACDEAIRRYNSLGLYITFQRVSSGADIIIYPVTNQSYLGSSGFPDSNGNPYSSISLNTTQLDNYSSTTNYIASVIQHEIGHCIGLRHTDYMNRAFSCGGSNVDEGAGYVGANLIPGTPSGPDQGSIMLACTGSTARDFNANDAIALNFLYANAVAQPFYRFYNSSNGRHFYSTNLNEGNANGYVYERTIGKIYNKMQDASNQSGALEPIYRFVSTYNQNDHIYNMMGTKSPAAGYVYEGIIGYAWISNFYAPSTAVPLYEFLSSGGEHFYTTSYGEGYISGATDTQKNFYILPN